MFVNHFYKFFLRKHEKSGLSILLSGAAGESTAVMERRAGTARLPSSLRTSWGPVWSVTSVGLDRIGFRVSWSSLAEAFAYTR